MSGHPRCSKCGGNPPLEPRLDPPICSRCRGNAPAGRPPNVPKVEDSPAKVPNVEPTDEFGENSPKYYEGWVSNRKAERTAVSGATSTRMRLEASMRRLKEDMESKNPVDREPQVCRSWTQSNDGCTFCQNGDWGNCFCDFTPMKYPRGVGSAEVKDLLECHKGF